MKREVTEEELEGVLIQFLDRIKKIDRYLYPVYDLLYKYGFRVNEVLELDRWSLNESGKFEVETEKKSRKRILLPALVPQEFIVALSRKRKGEVYSTYDVVKNRFQVYSTKSLYYSERKRICTHVFRHNYVKKMYKNGYSIDEISEKIGEVEPKNTEGYLTSIIYEMSADKIKRQNIWL